MEYKKGDAWNYQDDDDHTAIAPHCRQVALKYKANTVVHFSWLKKNTIESYQRVRVQCYVQNHRENPNDNTNLKYLKIKVT